MLPDLCAFLLGAASQGRVPLQSDSLIGHRRRNRCWMILVRHRLCDFITRELTRRLHSKMMRFQSGRPCSHPSFRNRRPRFSPFLLSQCHQMSAASTVTFSTRSLLYRQRFPNGQCHICSLCLPKRLLQLSRTSGILPLLGFLRARMVVITS